jgi:hypothetical protein
MCVSCVYRVCVCVCVCVCVSCLFTQTLRVPDSSLLYLWAVFVEVLGQHAQFNAVFGTLLLELTQGASTVLNSAEAYALFCFLFCFEFNITAWPTRSELFLIEVHLLCICVRFV